MYGVPTMFITILDHPLFNKFDFTTLRTGIMAGSPCPVKIDERVRGDDEHDRGDQRVRPDRVLAWA